MTHRATVAAALKRLRDEAGLTGDETATALGWSQSKVSRVETGRISVTIDDVARALDVLGADLAVRARLLRLTALAQAHDGAGTTRRPELPAARVPPDRAPADRAPVDPVPADRVRSLPPGGDIARLQGLRIYQCLVVPMLLQTPQYRAALGGDPAGLPGLDPAGLRGLGAHAVRVVLDARALVAGPVAPGVLAEQVRSLAGDLPAAVELRVLPLGTVRTTWAVPSFALVDYTAAEEDGEVVLLELHTHDVHLAARGDVAHYDQLFDVLVHEALDPAASGRYLGALAARLAEDPTLAGLARS